MAAARKRNQPSQQENAVMEKFNVNQEEQKRLFQVRKDFQTSLNKLSNNETKERVSISIHY
jgi:hypothetical protein